VPRSARTIWKILRQEGLILDPPAARHQPLPPREPLEEVQIDFKDVTTVPADPDGKRQHVVETCNFIDAGTSILLQAQVRDDFRAETAFDAVVAFLRRDALPHMFTFDRDPRWVGSQSGRDFPSALRRFLLCLGIDQSALPAASASKASLRRTLSPLVQIRVEAFASACHEASSQRSDPRLSRTLQLAASTSRALVPPRIAHPDLPHLPALEASVDPDRWVDHLHARAYVRHVGADGCVTVDERSYYIGLEHKSKAVALLINAPERCFEVS
jgi:hypothetical protein